MLYEWLDVRFFGWHKLNVHSMGPEVWRHFDLVYVACDHRSNGREGLKRFAIGVCRPRRVHDHTVPSLEPPHWRLLSGVQLYEGSVTATSARRSSLVDRAARQVYSSRALAGCPDRGGLLCEVGS